MCGSIGLLDPPLQLVFHHCALRREALATAFDQLFPSALVRFDGGHQAGAVKVHGSVAGLAANQCLVAWQVHKLARVKLLAELAVQVLGVGEPDSESDECADVAEDSIAHGGRELGDVLMAQRKVEPVLPRLGKNGSERLGREVLELIDEEIEVPPLVLGLPAACHRGELELRDEERTDQVRFVVTDLALSEVRDEDATLIHHEGDAHLAADLTDDVADDRGKEKLAHLVLYRRDGLAFEPLIVALELIHPVVLQKGIAHLADHPMPIGIVGQHPVHTKQGSVWALRERRHSVVQDELQARPPGLVPDVLERAYNARCHKMPLVVVCLQEQVQADGEVRITGMEVDGLLRAIRRDVVKQLFREIAVGIDQSNAVPLQDELEDQIAQQSGLSRTRFADHVGVVAGIGYVKTKRHLAAPDLALADEKVVFVHNAQASRRSMIDEPDETAPLVKMVRVRQGTWQTRYGRARRVVSDWLRRLNDGLYCIRNTGCSHTLVACSRNVSQSPKQIGGGSDQRPK